MCPEQRDPGKAFSCGLQNKPLISDFLHRAVHCEQLQEPPGGPVGGHAEFSCQLSPHRVQSAWRWAGFMSTIPSWFTCTKMGKKSLEKALTTM